MFTAADLCCSCNEPCIWRKCVLAEFANMRLGQSTMKIFPTNVVSKEAGEVILPIYVKFDVIFSST